MTERDLASWLPSLLGPSTILVDGDEITIKRSSINIAGGAQTDDPDNDRTNLTIAATPAGSSGDIQINTAGAFAGLTPPAGSLVGTTATQTITGKTIVAASNTITDTSAVAGDLLVHNGTRFVRLAKGTDTYVLTTTGGSVVWAAPSTTIAAPTLTGAITITGFTTTTTTSADGKVVTIDSLVSAQTTNATPAAAYTSGTLTDEAIHHIDVVVTAIQSDGSTGAVYKGSYSGRRDGGTWTALAAVSITATEDEAAWDATIDVSSNTFRVMVTGEAATTIRWGVAIRHQRTIP